jgi:Flp pilus assembly pilin Flp
MSRLSTKVSAACISAAALSTSLTTMIMSTSLTAAGRMIRAPRSRRAATFIEYAILAAIAVAIGLLIQEFLAGSSGWISKMLALLNNNSLNNVNYNNG